MKAIEKIKQLLESDYSIEGKNGNKPYNLATDLDKFYNKGQKAAGTRIRACMMELAKLAKEAKKETLN